MTKISATIITLNEEQNLSKCLDSLKGWIDEIIVVDSGSTDQTVSIAKRYQAKVFERKFDNYAKQKNFALDKTTNEWVFAIDADEEVPKSLASEIQDTVQSDEYSGYLIPRRNFILGAEIKHSRWSPDKHIWLWKKNSGCWQGDVHEEVVIEGNVGELKHAKLHNQDKTVLEFINSNKKYARLLAQKKVHEGQQFSLAHFLIDPVYEFSLRFIYKKGFLDGWRGFVLSLLMAWYKMDVWIQVLKSQK